MIELTVILAAFAAVSTFFGHVRIYRLRAEVLARDAEMYKLIMTIIAVRKAEDGNEATEERNADDGR